MSLAEHGAVAEIVVDLAAVRANVARLRALVAPAEPMVVVKADAYGHGLLEVARAAREAGATWLGVATLAEARRLRAAGDAGRLLCWLALPGQDYRDLLRDEVDVTVYDTAELDEVLAAVGELRDTGPDVVARVQLKIDTGLSRGGSSSAQWPELVAAARTAEESGLVWVTGVWSHFATSDDPDHPAGDAQEAAFDAALAVAHEAGLRPEVRHLANSAGALLRPDARHDLVRLGIAVYGLDPAPGHLPADVELRPAMTVRTRLVMVRDLAPGDAVSYGHTFTADRPMTVGLVPVGYADGVPRHASNAAEVLVRGTRCRILGRVCMDQFVVDVTGLDAERGDPVLLWGPGDAGEPTATDWAEAAGTINYEIVTRFGGSRTRRVVVG